MKTILVGLVMAAVLAGSFVAPTLAAKEKKKEQTPDQIFAKLDKNNDQKVSKNELVGKKQGEKATKAEKRFSKLDKNNDNELTLAEFKGAEKKKKNK